jgi:murein DD-endopeptidase MepM/ murein hydrolase activator NlpD
VVWAWGEAGSTLPIGKPALSFQMPAPIQTRSHRAITPTRGDAAIEYLPARAAFGVLLQLSGLAADLPLPAALRVAGGRADGAAGKSGYGTPGALTGLSVPLLGPVAQARRLPCGRGTEGIPSVAQRPATGAVADWRPSAIADWRPSATPACSPEPARTRRPASLRWRPRLGLLAPLVAVSCQLTFASVWTPADALAQVAPHRQLPVRHQAVHAAADSGAPVPGATPAAPAATGQAATPAASSPPPQDATAAAGTQAAGPPANPIPPFATYLLTGQGATNPAGPQGAAAPPVQPRAGAPAAHPPTAKPGQPAGKPNATAHAVTTAPAAGKPGGPAGPGKTPGAPSTPGTPPSPGKAATPGDAAKPGSGHHAAAGGPPKLHKKAARKLRRLHTAHKRTAKPKAAKTVSTPEASPRPVSPVTGSGASFDYSTPGPDLALLKEISGLYAATPQQPPAYLVPIYKEAGKRYDIPWRILAAINSIETDYGRDLSVSSAGAVGWMQFMPGTWKMYGVDASHTGVANPYDPRDAIFAAARLLAANGGDDDLTRAIYAYNHATWYVDAVLWRAKNIQEPHIGKARDTGYALPLDPPYMKHLGRTDDGVDIETAPDGAAVYSITSGVVTAVASNPGGFGPNYPVVQVTSGPLKGRSIYYGHVAAALVKVGQPVIAGQPIAVMGHTGDAAGLGHGHIEIGFSTPEGDPLNHHGGDPWTAAGEAMRALLVELSATFGIRNS